MNKANKIIVSIFAFAILSGAAVCYAQALNDWETGVFHDVINQWHEMLYVVTNSSNLTKDSYATIFQNVANKYNISVDQVKSIDNRGLDAANVSDKDYEIYDALVAKLKTTTTTDEARRVHMDIVNQYGITLAKLNEIEYYMEEGMWDW